MIDELESLGLGHYEAKALEILFKSHLGMRELSKRAGIPFGKIYSVIKNLKRKGFVSENNSRPKLVYVENASEIISRLIKEKQNKEKEMSEKLREIVTVIDNERGRETKFFEIGTSQEDNRRIQMRTFNEAEKEILQIINIHHNPKSNRESKTAWEKAHIDATKRGVITKAIYPEKVVLPKSLQELEKKYPNYKVKRLDTDFIRCDVIDGEKVLLKLVQQDPLQFGGVFFIENEKLAENLTRIFNELWENAR